MPGEVYVQTRWCITNQFICLKGLGNVGMSQNTMPQIYIKLKGSKVNDGRKLPLKYYLLRYFFFLEISKTMTKKYVLQLHVKTIFVSLRQTLFS